MGCLVLANLNLLILDELIAISSGNCHPGTNDDTGAGKALGLLTSACALSSCLCEYYVYGDRFLSDKAPATQTKHYDNFVKI